jgi:hypothetical protein
MTTKTDVGWIIESPTANNISVTYELHGCGYWRVNILSERRG